MWRNYLMVAFRSMRSSPAYAAINLVGLAVGIAAAALIFLYVRFETGYDRWLPAAERIHQLQTSMKIMGPEPVASAQAPRTAVEALRREFPEIEAVAALTSAPSVTKVDNEPRTTPLLLADPEFFRLFDLPFVRGDPATALDDMSSLVLTESKARSYFGSADPIGRTIEVETNGRRRPLRVAGVIADLPANTHLDLGLIARFNPAEVDPAMLGNWGAIDSFVYARLRRGANVEAINSRMPAFEKRNLGPFDQAFDYRLAPILGIHLSPALQGSMRAGGDVVAVRAFSVIAALVLLIACFNFTNLATARASQRAREVGLRKVLGASRRQLIVQFMTESILIAAVGTMLGLALVELLLPFFNNLLNLKLGLAYLGPAGIIFPALALILLVGTISGFYPAIYLSRFRPGEVLRASAGPGGGSGSGQLRGILVVGQFAIAIGLIICAAIVYAQTRFAREADPGFKARGLLVVENLWMPQMTNAAAAFRDQVRTLPGVTRVALAGNAPTNGMRVVAGVRRPGAKNPREVEIVSMDYGFPATMGMGITTGRDLSPRIGGDTAPAMDPFASPAGNAGPSTARFNVLLNRTAAVRLGFERPDAALGEELILPQGRATVVGLVGDVRYGSLRDPPTASVYLRNEAGFNYLLVRYSKTDPAALLRAVNGIWRRTAASTPFSAEFAEDVLGKPYAADAVRGKVFAIAAALAIVIACLGLFGLAAFSVERRKLEIAMRKVLGARDRDIVRLMVWQFSRPVLAANLVAWPAAWWLMRDWLNGFGERIALHPGWFVAAGMLALGIAIVTVTGHALRVSRTPPAAILRYE
jgi:putative ABC transport system permease protein